MASFGSSWYATKCFHEPPRAAIRVRNLQAAIAVGKDAWGRTGQTQRILISASIGLKDHFDTASKDDKMDESTVNYGTLSRGIMKAVDNFHANGKSGSLTELLDLILIYLTHHNFHGEKSDAASTEEVIINGMKAKLIEIQVMLPKASLLGTGVSLTGSSLYGSKTSQATAYSMSLCLHDLCVPTLIGLHEYERGSKQIIKASVTIDGWSCKLDLHPELEQIVVKTIEESSTYTLETLITQLSWRILEHFIIPSFRLSRQDFKGRPYSEDDESQIIHVVLEKPCLIPLSEAPAVEMRLDSNSRSSERAGNLWKWWRKAQMVPYPLEGRLDEWIGGSEVVNS